MRWLLAILLFGSLSVRAQHIYGTVSDESGTIPGVIITNQKTGNTAVSNDKGWFRLAARPGDSVHFSMMGYEQITIVLPQNQQGDYFRNIYLKENIYTLQEVNVGSQYTPYQRDSIARRRLYDQALSRERVSGVQAVFHPFSYLGEQITVKAKQRRRFQKNFYKWESDRFITTRYTPELVSELTRLQSDSLAYFMNAHPIKEDFARAATEMELKMWIMYNYRSWIKNPVMPKIEKIE